jgi:hypothetical protein
VSSDADIISEIDGAFSACPKPEHFGNHMHCGECAEHDRVLRDRTRETLTIDDVGNVGWDPIAFSDAAGVAYYFPALARLAMSPPTYEHGWYSGLLLIHLTYQGSDNLFLHFCNSQQRAAVGHLLRYLQENLPADIPGADTPLMSVADFLEARALWDER